MRAQRVREAAEPIILVIVRTEQDGEIRPGISTPTTSVTDRRTNKQTAVTLPV